MHTAHKFKDMQEGRGHGKICAYFMDMNKQCLHIGQPLNWVTSLKLILDPPQTVLNNVLYLILKGGEERLIHGFN